MFYYVGNNKGGSGNSFVSALVTEYFLAQGKEPVLIDGGGEPYDVERVYKNVTRCRIRALLSG